MTRTGINFAENAIALHQGRSKRAMGVLLIIAIPIFISLANKAVRENADAIRQGLGQ